MKQYIGTKLIEAAPAYRCMDGSGKVVITPHPEEAFPNYPSVEDGYRVRYPDGYVSWSPKDVFEEAYRPTDGMTFGLAIEAAKRGHKITRRKWGGANRYVEIAVYTRRSDEKGNTDSSPAFVFVSTSGVQVGWAPTQVDMMVEDWKIVE